MSQSKTEILHSIRSHALTEHELPATSVEGITFDDVRTQFVASLASVGGTGIVVQSLTEAKSQLESLPQFRQASQVVSRVDGVESQGIDFETIDDPHELAQVDFAILRGQFAVAENGAVWVNDENLKHRVLYFITQHLSLFVPASEVVHNMHEAYERLQFSQPGFGTFISGPSKTADIEQSLVIGAHGPRSLTVFLIEGV